MGARKSKIKMQTLSSIDVKFIEEETKMNENETNLIYTVFMSENPDGEMNRNEFAKIYTFFTNELPEKLDDITDYVFSAFDADKISFGEFLIAWSLAADIPDMKKRLIYAFDKYDVDNIEYLNNEEIQQVVPALLKLLSVKKAFDSNQLAQVVFKKLDLSKDRKIGKDELVKAISDIFQTAKFDIK